ncbi:Asp23/Gls24 family envelope stress response protein [Williamsia muralis]|uniref:Asp23/Gls24 family envelope stress response protein n=1 Tax=Williamsia marianensis TaxID=85044 RepID=UPI003F15191C
MTTTTSRQDDEPTIAGDEHRDSGGRGPDQSDAGGKTSIADVVVAKIAGIATREIDGVYDLGGGAARAVGKLRETLPGTAADVTQGVSVEVGEKQAAVDVGLVAYYGVAIHQLAESIRTNVIEAIEKMTGLEVTEVNVTVHDVHLDTDDPTTALDGQTPRVQ